MGVFITQSLKNLSYEKEVLLNSSFVYGGFPQRLYLSKSFLKNSGCDQYFLKVYSVQDTMICQGYIYFYIDFLTKTSHFIGVYVKPEYRSTGLASLLISSWIQFCCDYDFIHLTTNKKQRKPFLVYLLKTFGFEILNLERYQTSPYTIYICNEDDSKVKYLLFKNNNQAKSFLNGTIMQHDNYCVIEKLGEAMHILDNVLLSTPYDLQNEDKAYTKALHICKKHHG